MKQRTKLLHRLRKPRVFDVFRGDLEVLRAKKLMHVDGRVEEPLFPAVLACDEAKQSAAKQIQQHLLEGSHDFPLRHPLHRGNVETGPEVAGEGFAEGVDAVEERGSRGDFAGGEEVGPERHAEGLETVVERRAGGRSQQRGNFVETFGETGNRGGREGRFGAEGRGEFPRLFDEGVHEEVESAGKAERKWGNPGGASA